MNVYKVMAISCLGKNIFTTYAALDWRMCDVNLGCNNFAESADKVS